MYDKYYALQLYKRGYLRVKNQKNMKRLNSIIELANSYRIQKGYPAKFSLENVNHYPVHRKSIQELKNDLATCIKNGVTVEDCLTSTGHPEDNKWIQEQARKKLPSRQSLVKNHINMLRHTAVKRRVTPRRVTRRTPVPYMSFLKASTPVEKHSTDSE